MKSKGFKAPRSRNQRPDKSRGTKTHAPNSFSNGEKPRSPKSFNKQGGRDNTNSRDNNRAKDQKGYSGLWIWGQHAARACLDNPQRTVHKILLSPQCAARLRINPDELWNSVKPTLIPPSEIDAILPDGAAHQGFAVACAPLPDHGLEEIANPTEGLIVVLDQITDPHNVGAMFRLAKAFGARGIVMQNRNAPPLAGATAKVAVGTVETVPHVLVTNIANTLLALQKMNWRVTGLAGEADITLQQALRNPHPDIPTAEVIVMGAEGPGLRKRVRECCDQLAKIPMPGGTESLNVSTAAAIALYEAMRNG